MTEPGSVEINILPGEVEGEIKVAGEGERIE